MGMLALILGGALRLGGGLVLVGLIVGWGPFYLAHWEEYHTGILIMGKFNGPTEAQLIIMCMSLFSHFDIHSIFFRKLFRFLILLFSFVNTDWRNWSMGVGSTSVYYSRHSNLCKSFSIRFFFSFLYHHRYLYSLCLSHPLMIPFD